MVRRIFLIGLILLVMIHPALAGDEYAAKCESPPDVPVYITARFDPPVYNFDAGIAEIKALAADSQRTLHENLTFGLTRFEPMLHIDVPMVGVRFSDGRACSHVEHVDVIVGFQNVIVNVARELPQDSCGFNEIMVHEQKHIDVNMQILEEYIPRINNDLSAYLKENGSFHDIDAQNAASHLREKLREIITALMTDMEQDNQTRQMSVDTPEEYRRISVSCSGQLQEIAAQFLRAQR